LGAVEIGRGKKVSKIPELETRSQEGNPITLKLQMNIKEQVVRTLRETVERPRVKEGKMGGKEKNA